MNEVWAWAIIVFAVASCTAGETYFKTEAQKAMTPQQMCVQRAWTAADRVECLKASSPAAPDQSSQEKP